MPKPTTDKEIEKENQHLKLMIKMARIRPVNFGIALGKANEDLAFLAHQAKNPKSLRKRAKEQTGNSKGAHGEMTVDGKNLVFLCQDSPPGGLKMSMRDFLKDRKISLRAEFRLPDEAAVSAEDRDEEDKGENGEEKASTLGGEAKASTPDDEKGPLGQKEKLLVGLAKAAARIKALSDKQVSNKLWDRAGEIKRLAEWEDSAQLVLAAKELARLREDIGKAEAGKKAKERPSTLSVDKLLPALEKIDFIAGKLVDELKDGSSKDRVLPQGQTAKDHIAKVLKSYEEHFQEDHGSETNNAMMMVVALGGIGREIAAGLNDFSIQPVLTKKLLEVYRGDMVKILADDKSNPNEDKLERSMILLDALVSDDPLALYMHKEEGKSVGESRKIRTEDAVERIRGMALKGGVKATKMLELLSQRHQVEMGAYNKDEIKKGDLKDANSKFHFEDLIGEISEEFFTGLLDLDGAGEPQWEKSGGLKMSTPAQEKLDELKALLELWDDEAEERALEKAEYEKRRVAPEKDVSISSRKGVTKKEAKQRKKDDPEMAAVLKQLRKLSSSIVKGKHLDTPKGSDYVPPVGLETENIKPEDQEQFRQPLTEKQYTLIRNTIREEFEENLEGETQIDAARVNVAKFFEVDYGLSEKEAKDLVKKCENFLSKVPLTITFPADKWFPDNHEPIGTDYLNTQMRDKDITPASELLGDEDASDGIRTISPTKGFKQDRGGNYERWRKEKDDRETGKAGFMPDESALFGAVNINFPKTKGGANATYGNEHFVLNDSVRAHSTYCFTTKGKERRSMAMILEDIMKSPKREQYLPVIINNAVGISKGFDMGDLDLEFHCYGPIDLTKDVKEISVPEDSKKLDPETRKRLEKFAKKTAKVKVTRWTAQDTEDTYETGRTTDVVAPKAKALVAARARGFDPKAQPKRHRYEVAKRVFPDERPEFDGDSKYIDNYTELTTAFTALSDEEKRVLKPENDKLKKKYKQWAKMMKEKKPTQDFILKQNEILNSTIAKKILPLQLKNILVAFDKNFGGKDGVPTPQQNVPPLQQKKEYLLAERLSETAEHALLLYERQNQNPPERQFYELAKRIFYGKRPVSADDDDFKMNYMKWVAAFAALKKSDTFKTLKQKEKATLWAEITEGKAIRQRWEAEMSKTGSP